MMAKIQKVNFDRNREDVEEEQQEEVVSAAPSRREDPVHEAIVSKISSLETRLSASDLALLELSSELSEIRRLVERMAIRLDEERELRIRAHSDTIANMDQESLALRVFDICVDKYLEYESNNFERLADDPSIARLGMKWLVKAHRNLVNGIEHALRMG